MAILPLLESEQAIQTCEGASRESQIPNLPLIFLLRLLVLVALFTLLDSLGSFHFTETLRVAQKKALQQHLFLAF